MLWWSSVGQERGDYGAKVESILYSHNATIRFHCFDLSSQGDQAGVGLTLGQNAVYICLGLPLKQECNDSKRPVSSDRGVRQSSPARSDGSWRPTQTRPLLIRHP